MQMKLKKNIENRLKDADFYQLFIVDDKGIGYASQSGKKGVSKQGIMALFDRMEKEKQYLSQFLEINEVS
jgi:hypothetical protein